MIYEAVRRIQPYGATCRCPCGDGVATVTATDVLVSASISNWGAYGIAAQLAYELQDVELFQSEEMEDFMLRQCCCRGDGRRLCGPDLVCGWHLSAYPTRPGGHAA